MNKLYDLINAINESREQFEAIMSSGESTDFFTDEIYARGEWDHEDMLGSGDNLAFMIWLLKKQDMAGKIQLIYVDPPFFSNSRYQASVRLESEKLGKSPVIKTGAYDDRWEDSFKQYLSMLALRFMLMRELLSETGCIWVHLDWHGSHYVKMMLDEIFGESYFVNEVIWTYKSGGASKRKFAKKHDSLLFYSKTRNYKFNPLQEKSYNRGFKPYRFEGVEEFQDELGWYTKVNMKDVWSIDMVGRTSAERTGYATQKPEKLLERIVQACSDEGDLCADFFSGSGTLGAVCSRMKRRWIMCDEGDVATQSQILRLFGDKQKFHDGAFAVKRCEKLPAGSYVRFSKELGCLRVDEYKPDSFQLSAVDESIAEKYIGSSGSAAVSFWSVDPDFDGQTHRAKELVKGNDFCPLPGEIGERMHIVGYDVFGNRFEWE